jgi:hypothetical protein
MTRILLHSRRLLAVGVFLLLAVVVSLATATRRPCWHVCSGPWRVWKAGHMTKPESREICNLRVTIDVNTPPAAPDDVPSPFPSLTLPCDETPASHAAIVLQVWRFRAPPQRG